MRMYLITLLLVIVSNFGFSQSTNQLAIDFIYELDSVQEKAYNTYLDQSFKDKVEKEQMVKMWDQIEDMFGDFESSNHICIDNTAEYRQIFVSVKFKRKH
jgi:hypothetical protein